MHRKEWLYALLALIGGIVGGALGNRIWALRPAAAAEAAPRVITAQQFILVDSHGRKRATLWDAQGGPSLELYDASGKMLGAFALVGDNAGVRLDSAQGTVRALLSVNADNVSALRLYDTQGRPRTLLGVDNEGEPALDFYTENGKLLRELP